MLGKIKKEIQRLKKKLAGERHRQVELMQCALANMPYELCDRIRNKGFNVHVPVIKSAEETLDKILRDRCSLARFGDGEFSVMKGSRIHFQNHSPEMARRLQEVIGAELPQLLIGLPDCFGALDDFIPPVENFWRKWMARKRASVYEYLQMERVYYNAFFSRVYMPYHKTDQHYERCGRYFEKMKTLWAGRDVLICEGNGTRFGMFNDLLAGTRSISRILCPHRNAFDRYDEILSAVAAAGPDKLVLAALGPTATVLAYDLCRNGSQVIDVGHLDIEYEWFLRKDQEGHPLEFKYVDGTKEGRKINPVEDPQYRSQVIKEIF